MNDVMKKVFAAVAGLAGTGVAVFPPNTVAFKVSAVLLGLLGGGGIVSTGVTKPE